MKPAQVLGDLRELTSGQRSALVRLLEDDDPAVRGPVRARILACGSGVEEWLRPHLQDGDPRVREGVREILEEIWRREADTAFLRFCLNHGEDLDLEEGIWLLARTRYPEINVAAYRALLDSYASAVRVRLDGVTGAREILEGMNAFLYESHGFSGNSDNYYEADNSYLNRVLDRRTGNPISLCAVHLLVARRLHLPVAGIGMPGHFLCRYHSPTDEIYIDAFHGGRLLTKADCMRYLTQSSYGFQEGWLAPASPRRILMRMCSNLHQVYLHLKDKGESGRLQRYVVALAN